jgi:two-component system response regulator HydG
MKLMIVDDETIVRDSLCDWFHRYGHTAEGAASAHEALEKLERLPYDALFVDIKMPGMDGLELLERVKQEYPDTVVVIITAYGSIESAVQAMKQGAADYLLKPFNPSQLSLALEKVSNQVQQASECNFLKGHLNKMTRFENIIGQSEPMLKIYDMISEVAENDSSVLLTGETGTGKELIAKAVHAKSPRANAPFVPINCGAMPESLLESELFGHRKGAFTGASHARKGYLEVASGGTLFLDEIGEIGSKMQIDLLRVLEDKKICRVGSTEEIDVDFRLVAATRRNLKEEIARGRFREDFYYRVNVITIEVPPLRNRKEDIPLLVDHFLSKYSQETTKQVDNIGNDALNMLMSYDWPGNVRELENAVERAVVLSRKRRLDRSDFSFLQGHSGTERTDRSLHELEQRHIRQVLEECDWNVTQAAKILDINRVTLHRKINRYNLNRGSSSGRNATTA